MNQGYEFRRYSGKAYLPLYKYYQNYQYAEDAIVNQRIHLESPQEYNDIYDSAFVMCPDLLKKIANTKKNICNILRRLLPAKYQTVVEACSKTEDCDYFSVYDFISFSCTYDNAITEQELIADYISSINAGGLLQAFNNRISCFTERNDSILMWSYYGGKHTGVCLEFDITSDVFLKHYCSKINYSHYFTGNSTVLDGYFVKSEEWSHEQEWRIVCSTNCEYLPTHSLKSIILGSRIPDDKRDMFVDLGKKYDLKVYRATPSTTEFKLNIIPLI